MGPKATSKQTGSDASGSYGGGAGAGAPPRRVKNKRTRTGCLTCRARKVKCDETPGTCGNCERVVLECRWPVMRNVLDNRAETPPGKIGPIRHQRQAMCRACRSASAHCSQERPSCRRCAEKGAPCHYPDLQQNTPSSAESPGDADELRGNLIHDIPQEVVDKHVEAFFHHIYPVQANAIVHRPTLTREVRDGSVSRKVLLAICAVADRFVEPPLTPGAVPMPPGLQGSEQAKAWAAEAKASLLSSDMSLDNITTALILAKHDINSGRFGQAFVLTSVAMRTALALHLHFELPVDHSASITERETRRRLMWGCYSLDRMMSTGVPEFLLTPTEKLRIRLPCNEQAYLYGTVVHTAVPALENEKGSDVGLDPAAGGGPQTDNVGLLGHHLLLMGCRSMILRVSRNRTPSDMPPWDPGSKFDIVDRKIKNWYHSLPTQVQLEPETVYARKAQHELTPLVMLHVWYYQNLAELTRMAFPGFAESLDPELAKAAPPGWIEQKRDECASHARMIGDTLRRVAVLVDQESMFIADPALAICVYESCRIRLQYAFLLPAAQQTAELIELLNDVVLMTTILERMGRYFKNANWLLKETRRMLQRHNLDPAATNSEGSAPPSPGGQDPWSRRVRTLRENGPRPPPPPPPQYSHTHSHGGHGPGPGHGHGGHGHGGQVPMSNSATASGGHSTHATHSHSHSHSTHTQPHNGHSMHSTHSTHSMSSAPSAYSPHQHSHQHSLSNSQGHSHAQSPTHPAQPPPQSAQSHPQGTHNMHSGTYDTQHGSGHSHSHSQSASMPAPVVNTQQTIYTEPQSYTWQNNIMPGPDDISVLLGEYTPPATTSSYGSGGQGGGMFSGGFDWVAQGWDPSFVPQIDLAHLTPLDVLHNTGTA